MGIARNEVITWADLIQRAHDNLLGQIENLTGNVIPTSLNGTEILLSSSNAARTYCKSKKVWTTVDATTVSNDFYAFLTHRNLNDRSQQIVSTRLILNFFENLSQFYTNRLILVCASIGESSASGAGTKKLYYYNDGSSYDSWASNPGVIEDPVIDKEVTQEEIQTMLDNINGNLKNKVKAYSQDYTYRSTCSCSSCSSSSSSSSCWTILHQNLDLL